METSFTFSDVMFEPQYSKCKSRSVDIDLTSKVGKLELSLPLISANMADITEASMIFSMEEAGGLGILHRFMSIEENVEMFLHCLNELSEYTPMGQPLTDISKNIGVSIGVGKEGKKRFKRLYKAGAKTFCLDVAHGHHINVKKMLKWIKKNYKDDDMTIIAGNVATAEGALDIYNWGADVIKVGIGPGCFIAGTTVRTSKGVKSIEDVEKGDLVLTHRGRYKKVLDCISRPEKEKLYKINDIRCTDNHEFYVLHKKYTEIVNDENIDEYAQWIRADELTKDYLLLEVQE